jgi:hypothetical protein
MPKKIFGPKRDEVTGERTRLHKEEVLLLLLLLRARLH